MRVMRKFLIGCVCSSVATASLAAGTSMGDARVALASQKRELALALATHDTKLRANLVTQLSDAHPGVDFKQWLAAQPAASAELKSAVERDDLDIRQRKGLENEIGSLLQVRVANRSMLAALRKGVEPLYAYEPDGNESSWQAIEAFDRSGGLHLLDPRRMPQQPVLVVDIDSHKDLEAGLRLMRRSLSTSNGRAAASKSSAPQPMLAAAATTTPVTILDKIRLNDDEEPWISGDAEIYALVTGVDPSRDAPVIDLVDMPYLNNDGTDYSPNQILIFWDRYRWSAADVILMEHDDSTNYQTLVTNLINTATQILNSLGYNNVGTLVGLANNLVQAMPASWFSNDDDYVDSYYTIEKGQSYTNYVGAGANAMVTMHPSEIASQ